MKILICGGRHFSDQKLFYSTMEMVGQNVEFIHGGAAGADSMANKWAQDNSLAQTIYHADWKLYGRAAGPVRNKKMITDGKPDLVLAFPGGNGTRDMCDTAKANGIPIIKVGW